MDQLLFKINGLVYTYINNFHWDGCCLTISVDLKGKDYQITGNPCLNNFGYCTATFMYNARFLSPNVLFLMFLNDCYGAFLAMRSCFYCLKFPPFCEGHSFLCIVLYVDRKTKHTQMLLKTVISWRTAVRHPRH